MARHPLEDILNASADDILTAIQRGFRAQVDVKGKLAELYMDRAFTVLAESGAISAHVWQDIDGKPDFIVTYEGREIIVECKNIRNEMYKTPPAFKVELQKTRNSMDGTPTRGYGCNEFDVLGVSLFNQTHEWVYLYIATKHLDRRPDHPDLLKVMQRVPIGPDLGIWNTDPLATFEDALK